MTHARTLVALAIIAVVCTLAPLGRHTSAAGGSTLTRPEDPVVLTGADLPLFTGIAPDTLVAFRYEAGWVQIPVQVDERDLKNFQAIYNSGPDFNGIALQYTDAGTYTGPDSDPTIDGNDEIVFMANDAGGAAPSFSEPAGVVAASGLQLKVTDPDAPGEAGYVYLFRQDGSLDPSAGQSYVTYGFDLLSGDYKTTYNFTNNGGNPEDSTVTTPNYSYHFGDRWQEDVMKVSAGGATNVDLLDRHKALFDPGYCGRSEDTFDGIIMSSPIEGAFVANKSGPVRAIRSYVGANSGPLTERTHIFYAQRQDIRTDLRVHAIPSVMDFFDYSPAASGMTYYNDLNTGGVTIDGVPETPAAGPIVWQMVTGAQGTVVQAGTIVTNLPGFSYTSYYLDKSAPPALTGDDLQCTGDASSYGASGVYVNVAVACTDPRLSCPYFMNTTSTLYYQPPSQPVSVAESLYDQATTPLVFSMQSWQSTSGDADGDGVLNITDTCPLTANADQLNTDAAPRDNGTNLPGDDTTWPGSDLAGNVCDPDDDNDGLADAAEASGSTCGGVATNPLLVDTDGDHLADGWECAHGSNPTNASSKFIGTPAADADADHIPDVWEQRGYNTSDTRADSDGDGCADLVETASVDGNHAITDTDRLAVARRAFNIWTPNAAQDYVLDIDKNGSVADPDRLFVARAALLLDWQPKTCP